MTQLDPETMLRIDRLLAAFRVQILRTLMHKVGGEVVAHARIVRGQLAQDSHVEPPWEYPLRCGDVPATREDPLTQRPEEA